MFKKNKLDITKLLAAFYVGTGIYVLICLIITIYGMGTPFHVIVYSNSKLGYTELVTKAPILVGFSATLEDNGVMMLGNIALLASTGLLAAFFIDRKKNPLFFYGALIGGICGLLTIILLPVIFALVIFLLGLALVSIVKLPIKRKKVAIISCLAVFGLLAISYAIFRIDNHLHANKYNGLNYILKAILFQNPGLFANFASMKDLFAKFPAIIGSGIKQNVDAGSFVVNVLYQNGIIALIGLLTFFVCSIIEIVKFWKTDEDVLIKTVITTLFGVFFGTLLINDMQILPLILDFVFLGILILIGYVAGYNLEYKKTLENKQE